jgi:hypothetical protein
MQYVFPVLAVLAMLGALGSLGLGLISMARGNDPHRSNRLMRSRVLFQALAIAFFVLFMLLFRHH